MRVRPGPRPSVDERLFVPINLDAARCLNDALLETGTPLSQARAIVGWLINLGEKRSDDPSTDMVRRRYRAALGRISESPDGSASARFVNEYMGAYIRSVEDGKPTKLRPFLMPSLLAA